MTPRHAPLWMALWTSNHIVLYIQQVRLQICTCPVEIIVVHDAAECSTNRWTITKYFVIKECRGVMFKNWSKHLDKKRFIVVQRNLQMVMETDKVDTSDPPKLLTIMLSYLLLTRHILTSTVKSLLHQNFASS